MGRLRVTELKGVTGVKLWESYAVVCVKTEVILFFFIALFSYSFTGLHKPHIQSLTSVVQRMDNSWQALVESLMDSYHSIVL